MQNKTLKSIGVIGGGSAGYFAALYLKKKIPDADVTVIESSKIPVIGVGEATTPLLLKVLHKTLGFPVGEFMREAQPTLKLGIRFNWGKPGSCSFNSPFGKTDIPNAIYHTGDVNNLSLIAQLMEQNKAPFIRLGNKITPLKEDRGYGYHIDNKHFLKYLKSKLAVFGCKSVDTEIDQVNLTADKQSIDHLVSVTGDIHRYDLYIDCSGFRSLLLGKALKTPFIDFAENLKTNRAIVGITPNEGEIDAYTSATTLKHGWLWKSPMRHEDHFGYVFSKEFCSDDEARSEMARYCKNVNNERVLAFRSGRHAEAWRGNVVGIGNAYAFVEPLQSTGIHMILREIRTLSRCLQSPSNFADAAKTYNHDTNGEWDALRWFIALHFKLNFKLDTPFWTWCQNELDISGLNQYINYFIKNGPLAFHKDHPLYDVVNKHAFFSTAAYDVHVAGFGVNQEFFKKRFFTVYDGWPMRNKLNSLIINAAISHRDALKFMEENEGIFSPQLGIPLYQP